MKKKWTGERLETFILNVTTIEHLHRYALAAELAKGKTVLDVACGEGYGSHLLSKSAFKVFGVDISKEIIDAAKLKYVKNNIQFSVGNASSLDFANESLDLVVSFETIEHHNQHEEMLSEVKRVLKKSGVVMISTPDKLRYSDIPRYKNPFHVKELYFDEFEDLIKKYFKNYIFIGQRAGFYSIAFTKNANLSPKSYTGDYDNLVADDNWDPLYWIAIASNSEIPNFSLNSFFYADFVEDLAVQAVRDSLSFRLGNAIVYTFSRFSLFRKIWNFIFK
jgi:ubiquinone/menaquinone biosynthesis C-methylase UbiE